MKPDVIERLRATLIMRPGTADSDVNVLAIPVSVPWGDVEDAIKEIERLRATLRLCVRGPNAVQIAKGELIGLCLNDGPSYADIRRDAKLTPSIEPGEPS
jgi:hypothetical protein